MTASLTSVEMVERVTDLNEANIDALCAEKLEKVRQLFGDLSVALYALNEVYETMGKTISAMGEINDRLVNAVWAQILADGTALEMTRKRAEKIQQLHDEIERLRGLLDQSVTGQGG